MNIGEANRVRSCLDCGEPGALLWRTTKGENTGRLLRVCAACLRKDDWHVFGLVERQPILGEVPTEFFEGEWHFPKADGPEPWAVITYTDEPSPETGHEGARLLRRPTTSPSGHRRAETASVTRRPW